MSAPETTVVERHGRAVPIRSPDGAHALRVAGNWSEIATDLERIIAVSSPPRPGGGEII